jgi:hypothetical protein
VSHALYSPGAPPDQLAMFGMTTLDLDDTIEVLPDNWDAFVLFDSMSTQWRTGFSGRTGLDYSVLPSVMNLLGFPKKIRNSLFQDVIVMETEALLVMSEEK